MLQPSRLAGLQAGHGCGNCNDRHQPGQPAEVAIFYENSCKYRTFDRIFIQGVSSIVDCLSKGL